MNLKLFLGFVLLSLSYPSIYSSQILHSQRVTHWGSWGPWEYCQNGEVAIGMRLKTDQIECGNDLTTLNGIQLYCGQPGQNVNESNYIRSSEGPWGTWGTVYKCPGFITGFQLRSTPSLGQGGGWSRDDTAANNLRIYCGPEDSIFMDGDGYNGRSSFSDRRDCKLSHAVCGLRTQVEPPQRGSIDDSSLNNVDMSCCLPTPPKKEEPEYDYDNISQQ